MSAFRQRDTKATGKCPPVHRIRDSEEFKAFETEALSLPWTWRGSDEYAIFMMRCLRADGVATALAEGDDRALLLATARLLLFMVDEQDECRPDGPRP